MTHPTSGPLLRAVGLRRVFGTIAAIDGVDLAIERGARHAIIGPNGAGKTTLLDLLAGTQRPTAGRIHLAGRDITGRGAVHHARAGIARSFQTPTVIPTLSTMDNLVLGAWPRINPGRYRGRRYRTLYGRALHQLETLGLADHAHTPAAALSHGQRRLLDIAMALAGVPTLLLLDEPAAGLHGGADLDRLLALLRGLPPQMAVVLVEHHMDVVAAIATTVTVLHHGQVLATGPQHQITRDPAVRLAYPGLAPANGQEDRSVAG